MNPACVFFTQVKGANKASQVLLPVFFGQADACVVTASAFAVMAELNPQIHSRLQVLKRSPELVLLLLCATDLAAPDARQSLMAEALSAEKNPSLRQALTIVQMKRFIPFKPEYFTGTEGLLRRHRQLKAAHGGDPS